ncbi:class I SAM-dependent methyltransferase [Acidimicrobiia bacterium]|nr:class I SAM-dependent methyltransferase [Acidimicrobiia bacterium]
MFRSLLIYISKSFRYGKFEKTIQSKARNAGISYYASNDDDIATLNNNLIKKVCKWGELAYSIKLVADHSLPGAKFYNQFPGEHYRLLASIVNTEKPVLMIDIGTYTGMSSKVLLDHSESDSRIITFDLIKWDNFDSYLKKEDFDSGRIVQEISDLSIVDNFLEHKKNFNDADLIFIDAPKDGKFEKIFFKNLSNINFDNKKRILIIDDIRVPEMFEAWRFIDSPKLDATTFGHWSGTGIVDITEGLKLK